MISAFAPANGSLIFETYEATAEYGRGSLGVGFTLNGGVKVEVEILPNTSNRPALDLQSEILVAGSHWEFPTVREVIRRLAATPVRVNLIADFPFGCGYGMSGASALATAYALGRLFQLPFSPTELAMVAHEAEVTHATGRGDVGGQFNGGFMVKRIPGRPLHVDWLAIPESTVYCRTFGPISTSEVLRDAATMQRVNRAGHAALSRLSALGPEIDLDALLHLSCDFAERSGLLTSPRVRTAIREAELMGGHASMIMLGEAVVSTVPINGSRAWRVVRSPAALVPPAS
jgi:pantoate kinase